MNTKETNVRSDEGKTGASGRRQSRRRKVRRTKGSMFQRLMDAVPFPAIFGDLVQQAVMVLTAMTDFRSPLDTRKHEGLKQSKTQAHRRRQTVYLAVRYLRRRYRGLTLLKIRRQHILALLEVWGKRVVRRKMEAGAVLNRLAHLRAFLAYARLDVECIVPTNTEALRFMGIRPRVWFDGRDRSLEGNAVDFWVVFERAWAVDPRVAVIFFIAWRFGFRLEEACKWRAAKDFVDLGATGYIRVMRGTKNGKLRGFVMRLTADDRAAIALAKLYAAKGTGGLIPDEVVEEKRFRSHVNGVARRIGFTRRGLGVTPHGLRHSFARRTHGGHLRRLNGGVLPAGMVSPEQDFVARRATSETLGHHRIGITSCYLGAPSKPFALPGPGC
jgi:integrase